MKSTTLWNVTLYRLVKNELTLGSYLLGQISGFCLNGLSFSAETYGVPSQRQ
jgi:hypothetical protein